jgi:hypothetical protein
MINVGEMNDRYAWATAGRLFVTCLIAQPTVQSLEIISAAGQKHRAIHKPVVAITLVPLRVPLPDDAARKFSAKLMKDGSHETAASAIVLEGDGFWASAARAAVAGMYLLSGSNMAQKPFASIDDAVGWIAPMLSVDPSALVAGLKDLREKHLRLLGSKPDGRP